MKGHAFRSTATCVSNSLEASGNNQLFQKFIPGDIAWIKIHNNSWWPGQVVDEKSIDVKPKRKSKDEILIRLYGTYDYLYMDPLKCNMEFENFLKQDNITMKEAFQKSLDEDLSHTISSGYSKGRVSHFRGHTTSESPKGKMQKQIKTARNQKEIGSSNKQKEGSSKQKRKYDARDKAARNTKTKEDEGREQRINVKYGKEAIGGNSIRQEQTMEMFSNEVAGNRAMEQGEARKNIAMKMVRIAASTCKNMKPSDFEEQKRGNATQPKKIESLKSDHQAKFSAPESAVDISARKTKVMRSLGLIPPSGSPFHRNRILEVAHLKT